MTARWRAKRSVMVPSLSHKQAAAATTECFLIAVILDSMSRRSGQRRDDRGAISGHCLVRLVVHEVHGELVRADVRELAEPLQVRRHRTGQAEPVDDGV